MSSQVATNEESNLLSTDRRGFLKSAGLVGGAAIGAGLMSGIDSNFAFADSSLDAKILNFALNLEYLEAEFYSFAVHGHGLSSTLTTGTGTQGGVVGGRQVNFSSRKVRLYATEIAGDELAHVKFLRSALGAGAVAQPKIDIKHSFTAAARAAGLISSTQTFDPYANENNFLLAAFIFEDVGVTAYKGAAPLISKTYIEAAAGIMAVEAYHAATIRTNLYSKGLYNQARAISDARDSLDGTKNDDQGIGSYHRANIVPTNDNGLVFSRSAGHVLNIVYLTPHAASKGGFFPRGVNGAIHTSTAN